MSLPQCPCCGQSLAGSSLWEVWPQHKLQGRFQGPATGAFSQWHPAVGDLRGRVSGPPHILQTEQHDCCWMHRVHSSSKLKSQPTQGNKSASFCHLMSSHLYTKNSNRQKGRLSICLPPVTCQLVTPWQSQPLTRTYSRHCAWQGIRHTSLHLPINCWESTISSLQVRRLRLHQVK